MRCGHTPVTEVEVPDGIKMPCTGLKAWLYRNCNALVKYTDSALRACKFLQDLFDCAVPLLLRLSLSLSVSSCEIGSTLLATRQHLFVKCRDGEYRVHIVCCLLRSRMSGRSNVRTVQSQVATIV